MNMANVFEGDVKKNLLERTEAEKVFRPWWDTLEDYLLNILILIGQSIRNSVKKDKCKAQGSTTTMLHGQDDSYTNRFVNSRFFKIEEYFCTFILKCYKQAPPKWSVSGLISHYYDYGQYQSAMIALWTE